MRNFVAAAIPSHKTRKHIAREIGISRVHLQRIIAGKQLPSIKIALKISTVLQKPVESLFQLNPDQEGEGKRMRGKTKTTRQVGSGHWRKADFADSHFGRMTKE